MKVPDNHSLSALLPKKRNEEDLFFIKYGLNPDRAHRTASVVYQCAAVSSKGVVNVNINTESLVFISDVTQNFSRVARLVDEENCSVSILQQKTRVGSRLLSLFSPVS